MNTERTMQWMNVSKNATILAGSNDLGGSAYKHFRFWLDTGAVAMHLTTNTATATTSHAKWDATQGVLALDFETPMVLAGIPTTTAAGNYNLIAWN